MKRILTGLLVIIVIFISGVFYGVQRTQNRNERGWEIVRKQQELEELVNETICRARVYDAIITERIRLTGRPNPPLNGEYHGDEAQDSITKEK